MTLIIGIAVYLAVGCVLFGRIDLPGERVRRPAAFWLTAAGCVMAWPLLLLGDLIAVVLAGHHD